MTVTASSYEPLQAEGKEETFNEMLRRNKRKRDRLMGSKSSVSSKSGGDSMIQNRMEKL